MSAMIFCVLGSFLSGRNYIWTKQKIGYPKENIDSPANLHLTNPSANVGVIVWEVLGIHAYIWASMSVG